MFNIITRTTLLDYCERYSGAKNALLEWYYEFLNRDIKTFQELKQHYPNASLEGDDRVVLNIMGNHYRLAIRMVFTYKAIQMVWNP